MFKLISALVSIAAFFAGPAAASQVLPPLIFYEAGGVLADARRVMGSDRRREPPASAEQAERPVHIAYQRRNHLMDLYDGRQCWSATAD